MILLDTSVLSLAFRRVRGEAQFARLEAALEGCPVLLAERAHHDARLFTADQDFTRMAPRSGLRLLDIR